MTGGPAQWLRNLSGPRRPEDGADPEIVPAFAEFQAADQLADPVPVPVPPTATATEESEAEAMQPLLVGELRDLATEAPHVGRLLQAVAPNLKAATALRVPSVIMDGVRCGDFCVAGASHAGGSHLHGGTPRQDSYDFVVTSSGRLVVAIADGLGSRPYSQLGARLFGEQVVQIGLEQPDALAETFLAEAAERVAVLAENHYGVAVRDVGFVAGVAVFEADVCTVARVGDVSAFARTPESDFAELFPDDDGAMNKVSTSLPGAATPEVVTVRSDRVVLATDGLAGDLRLSPAVREWLGEQWSAPVSAFLMTDSLRFRRQGSHDDRTAVAVWHRPEGVS